MASPASAYPGTGFTGELWYGSASYRTLDYEYASVYHSYGFNSGTAIGGSSGFIQVGIRNFDNGNTAAMGSGHDHVRVCVHGSYPNCVDTDGWTGGAWILNADSRWAMTIQGHGVY